MNDIITGQKLMGYKKMKLSNSWFDPTFLKELLATKIYQRYLPTYETNLLKVNTQGSYTGLYLNQEPINKQFLEKHFSTFPDLWMGPRPWTWPQALGPLLLGGWALISPSVDGSRSHIAPGGCPCWRRGGHPRGTRATGLCCARTGR